MSWCYLDTRLKGITFLVLSAREICGGDLGRASEGDRAITLVSRNPRL
ncbi:MULTISPECIES: hypothetical protein [unclassified Microcoleus]